MSVNFTEYYVQLINKRTGSVIDDDSGVYNVLTAGSPVEATIYSDDKGTSGSNPGTMTDGIVQFWTASSVSSVDISIYTANGEALFLQGVTADQHRAEVDVDKMEQTLVIPFLANDNSELDTGFTLNGNVLIEDVMLKVVTVDAGETIDVGTDGTTTNDPNGLIAAALVSAAGYIELNPQITGGSNIDHVGTNFVGELLATSIVGADAVATVGGQTRLKTLVASTETDCNITYTGSAGSDTAAGYIMLQLRKLL